MTYTLPDLAYDPAALEPHLRARIVELHHGKHHAAYVAGANSDAGEAWPRRARPARLGRHRRAREETGVQPRRPRAAHDVLDEPVA